MWSSSIPAGLEPEQGEGGCTHLQGPRDKGPQTGQLKPTGMCCLPALEAGGLRSRCQQARSPPGDPGARPFLAPSWLLLVAGHPWPEALSLQPLPRLSHGILPHVSVSSPLPDRTPAVGLGPPYSNMTSSSPITSAKPIFWKDFTVRGSGLT